MNDSLSEYRVEEKVSKIKHALQKLGAAFKATEHSQDDTAKMNSSYTEPFPESWGRRSTESKGYNDQFLGSESLSSPKFQIPSSARSSQHYRETSLSREWPLKAGLEHETKPLIDPTSSIIYKKSLDLTDARTEGRGDGWELSVMLENERERIAKLESQLSYKESLLEESLRLQQELYCRLEDTHRQQNELEERFDREYSELEKALKILEAKNHRLDKENNDLKADLAKLEKEKPLIRELMLNIEELESRLHKQRKSSNEEQLKAKLAERGEEVELLREEIQRIEHEFRNSQASEIELKGELDSVQKELSIARVTTQGMLKGSLVGKRSVYGSHEDREVEALRDENSGLRDKLSSAWKELKETERKQESHRGRHRKPKPEKSLRKASSRSRSTTPSDMKFKELYADLEVSSLRDALQAVRDLKARLSRSASQVKFTDRVVELVKSTTSSSKEKVPSLKSLYRWLARVIDDYYLIKKQQETEAVGSEVMHRLVHICEAEHVDDLPGIVTRLLADRNSLKQMIGQIKTFVSSDART